MVEKSYPDAELRVERDSLPLLDPNKKLKKSFLTRRSDYLKTYKGRVARGRFLVVYGLHGNKGTQVRLGITVPRASGNAVRRNRFKRWAKEFFRKLETDAFDKPIDLHLVVGRRGQKKEDLESVSHLEFTDEFKKLISTYTKRA